jgi:transposase-like protein
MPRFVPTEELFKGRHFDQEIVVLCVRWYLSFKLSFRDLVGLAHNSAVGTALHSGIREAMEAIRARCRRVLADG